MHLGLASDIDMESSTQCEAQVEDTAWCMLERESERERESVCACERYTKQEAKQHESKKK